jgi:aminoglycoside phosphotransferase (APT) family kinase protein
MERLNGRVFRSLPDDGQLDRGVPRRLFEKLIEAMAELHAVDYAALGLGHLGRPEGYLTRQIEGWQKRLRAAATPDMADFSRVTDWLGSHMPEESKRGSVVHNDFKLDNLMFDLIDPARLIAVLDWEMATIGDPLLDLAYTLSFWIDRDDPPEFQAVRGMPSARPDVPSRQDAIMLYRQRAEFETAKMRYYLCLAFLRRAAINQQHYARFVRGESSDPRYAGLNRDVAVMRDMCLRVMSGRTAI